MSSDLDNILNLIKSVDNNNCFSVFAPSLQKEITFKQLTTEQLKRILKTIIDTPLNNTEFILTINSIIKENCITDDINVEKLTVLDKQIILLKIRIESISSKYTFEINDSKFTVSLSEKLSNFLEKQTLFDNETYSNDTCLITCCLPNIETENKLEKELHYNVTKTINTPTDLKNLIGEAFINEIAKFINTLTINDSVIDLSTYNFKDRVKIIEKLPISLINNVIKYIERYRDIIKTLFTFNLVIDDNVVIEREILLDASFFNS